MPSEPETPWHTTVYGVLRHPADGRPLALPPCAVDRRLRSTETSAVSGLFQEGTGLQVIVLRRLAQIDDPASRRQVLFALEPRPGAALPAGATLTPAGAAGWDPPPHPRLREALATWHAESGPSLRRNPWAQEGWFGTAAAWMSERAAGQGRPLTGPVQQEKSWSISCILRAPTSAGDVFLKAVPPLFAVEPRITAFLAQRFPRHVPPVLATDPRRRWTLMGDAGAMLKRGADAAVWEGLGRCLARLQVAFAGQGETLLSLGCPDRRLARFLLELEGFVAPPDPPGPPEQLPGRRPDASPELLARLREALPRVRRACAALEAVGVPATLVHGDLHGGNVAWRDGEPVFFDWTDAFLGHPFLDLITLWGDDPAAPPAPHSIRLREVYLEAWADYAPAARLREALELGLALGALYQTLSYHRIISSIEPALGAEWSGALPSWLRQGLDRLDRLDLPG